MIITKKDMAVLLPNHTKRLDTTSIVAGFFTTSFPAFFHFKNHLS